MKPTAPLLSFLSVLSITSLPLAHAKNNAYPGNPNYKGPHKLPSHRNLHPHSHRQPASLMTKQGFSMNLPGLVHSSDAPIGNLSY